MKREQRNQRHSELAPAKGGVLGTKDPYTRLHEAAIAYADAVENGDHDSAWENLLDAANWATLGVPKKPALLRARRVAIGTARETMRQALLAQR